MLGVSRRTVCRRIREYGIDPSTTYTDMSDDDLDTVVSGIESSFPNCGQRMTDGLLRAQGIRVQRHRIRESIRRTDLAVVINRRRLALVQRTYNVPHPNALWHIDGNHKLIRLDSMSPYWMYVVTVSLLQLLFFICKYQLEQYKIKLYSNTWARVGIKNSVVVS